MKYLLVVNFGSGRRSGDSSGYLVKHSCDARSVTLHETININLLKMNSLKGHLMTPTIGK